MEETEIDDHEQKARNDVGRKAFDMVWCVRELNTAALGSTTVEEHLKELAERYRENSMILRGSGELGDSLRAHFNWLDIELALRMYRKAKDITDRIADSHHKLNRVELGNSEQAQKYVDEIMDA